MGTSSKLTKRELIDRLIAASFDGTAIPADIANAFEISLKLVEGHVAHMRYAEVAHVLSEKGFRQFLAMLEISDEDFANYRDMTCEGDIAARDCIYTSGGFCDPSWCHGH